MPRAGGKIVGNKLLVFQTAYPLTMIKSMGLESYIQSKDPGDFFSKILTVNSIASVQDLEFFRSGKMFRTHILDKKHTLIESSHLLKHFRGKFLKLSFIFSQSYLVLRVFFSGQLRHVSIVYADDPAYNGILGLLFAKILRVPLVVGIWGNPERLRKMTGKPLMPRLFRTATIEGRIERYILNRAQAIQVQNLENGTYPLGLGISSERISYLPLGAGIADFHFIPPDKRGESLLNEKLDVQAFQMVCISRLIDVKHVDHAINGLKDLRDRSVRFQLHIFGAGAKREDLVSQACKMGVDKSVVFHGNQSQEAIANFLPKMDIAIAPITGRALLEIGLAGLPVVAYDVDWHNEIVKDGETGKLVEYLNQRELSLAILDLYNMGNVKRETLGNQMRSRSLDLSSPQILGKRQNNFYRLLLKGYARNLRTSE
jgi:glycosyltransferase involved in cell wall biosynthesis